MVRSGRASETFNEEETGLKFQRSLGKMLMVTHRETCVTRKISSGPKLPDAWELSIDSQRSWKTCEGPPLTPIFPVDRSNTRSLTQYIYPLKTFVKGISSSMWGRKRTLKVSPLFIHCEWIKSSSKQSNLSYKYRYNIQVILWVFPLLAF